MQKVQTILKLKWSLTVICMFDKDPVKNEVPIIWTTLYV